MFFIFFKTLNKDPENQLGIILDSGYDFRYQGGNMSYILQVNPCADSNIFDSRCLQAYSNSTALVSNDLSLYYQYNLTMMLKSSPNIVFSYFLPLDYFIDTEMTSDSYIQLLINKEGSSIFEYQSELVNKIFNYNLSSYLALQGYEIYEQADTVLLPAISNNLGFIELNGYNSDYLCSFNDALSNNSNTSMGLVTLIIMNKRLALQDFFTFQDNIFNIIVAQVSIFLIFISLGILATYKLSLSIHSRISIPLSIIEAYLVGTIPKIPKICSNKEINEINRYLLIIETIEQLINPRFLLNPNAAERLENLKEVDSLFQAVKNSKGLAIIKNLIGNIYLDEEEFDKAIDYYRESLAEMEALYNEVVAQENAESALSYDERKLLRLKTGKETQGWDLEKSAIKANICDRVRQLYYAKELSLENSLESAAELRSE